MYYPYSKTDCYEEVMRKYTNSRICLFINPEELIKYYSIVHQYDYSCSEDVIYQLIFELNNIIFATTPVKMCDILQFTANYLSINKNICFCFLADFYVRNILDNKELYR